MEDIKTIASDELLMEQLTNRDWNEFWLRLMGRCAWLLRKRYGVKWPNPELQSFSRKVISEVIDKIFLEKKRHWYTDSYPTFEKFIISAVDSHVNNTLKKRQDEQAIGSAEFIFDNETEVDWSKEDHLISAELRKEIYDDLQAAGADDDEIMVFDCLVDGISKPDDIRSELGLSEENFHNIWRRLKRKRDVIRKKLAGYGH